jgi:diguanylate cyclase (GGDEF)-like protein
MSAPGKCVWSWIALAAMVTCGLCHAQSDGVPESPPSPDAQLLSSTEALRTTDRPRFLAQLEELQRRAPSMTAGERWRLRYLDAWEASFEGRYAVADPLFHDIIERSADVTLVTKAQAVLMDDLAANKHYQEAFELANRLVLGLQNVQDRHARFIAMQFLSQLLRSAGQYDLAAQYAREMDRERPAEESSCKPITVLLSVLYEQRALNSASPDLHQGIAACESANEPIFSNAIWLVLGSLYIDENRPREAIALLKRIAPEIRASRYYSHMLAAQVELAQAYEKIKDDDRAKQAALAAIAMSEPDDLSESLRDAYDVLYRIEKRRGNAGAALAYYERYVAQDKGRLDDISARTLAYQVAQQHSLVDKLQTERLSKQNSILKLQQALDAKAVEASRLYITLLAITLAAIVLWLFRTTRSQRRFKRMATRDGLTGIHNHQHFMGECDKRLRALEKRSAHGCLVWIDLDHFKQINDTHGHATGDAALRHSVAICQRQLRPGDLLGRLGGEEFGILLGDCPREQAIAIADRIRLAIEASPMVLDGSVVSISASIGVASTATSGHDLQPLCRDADAALYRAKRAGRNRVVADADDRDAVCA